MPCRQTLSCSSDVRLHSSTEPFEFRGQTMCDCNDRNEKIYILFSSLRPLDKANASHLTLDRRCSSIERVSLVGLCIAISQLSLGWCVVFVQKLLRKTCSPDWSKVRKHRTSDWLEPFNSSGETVVDQVY